ncbi:MAG TPA: endonuclease domain-containing protein [Saprospiraceae bacterium]
MQKRNMHLGAKSSVFRNADRLRRNPTEAEEVLWKHLRNRQMEGVKFRRQHPIKGYVADFYANSLKFIIELDGGYHNNSVQKFYDKDREDILNDYNIDFLRFTNDEVLHNINHVLSVIRERIIVLKHSKKKK